jgi:hypothetical protein
MVLHRTGLNFLARLAAGYFFARLNGRTMVLGCSLRPNSTVRAE